MNTSKYRLSSFGVLALAGLLAQTAAAAEDQVTVANGTLAGTGANAAGIRMFKGIPFAQPPVGEQRWQAPQPVQNWTGVRPANRFGPRCMQQAVFGDMNFRSNGNSEDCLYLNVWTPAHSVAEKLPVLVYLYGGGYVAGDGSEPRYDGESLARKGIVTVTVNYRLGFFGFLAHPALTAESPHHASGDYGLLDQSAALHWVAANIAAFGGDPKHITIGGESAGSTSVSAQMASPLSRDLIVGAIGESGSLMGTLTPVSLAKAEEEGTKFAEAAGVHSIAELRALTPDQLFAVAKKSSSGHAPVDIDGYFFPEGPAQIFEQGKQAHVPLLVGWNSGESNGGTILGHDAPTADNYAKAVQKLYGPDADAVLKAYPGSTPEAAVASADDLASDRFIGFSTWKWFDLARKTGGEPVYRYFYARPRPPMRPEMGDATAGLAGGVIRGGSAKPAKPDTAAVHSAEIEYALGNLDSNKVFAWTADDHKVSQVMEEFFANFIKTGNPNGPGLPSWPAAGASGPVQVMHIDVQSAAEPEQHAARYALLDQLAHKPAAQ